MYQRSRLFDLLDAARRQHSATLVTGPPGAGKTTLISSYIEFRNLRSLWYQVDSGDEDIATFFHYFSQAAEKHLPAGAASLPHFDPGAALGVARFSRQYFREFYAGLGCPFVVILDNYQDLADESELHEVVRVACEEVPEDCHVVIVGRETSPKALARLHVNHALTVVGAADLTLTVEETRGIAELQGVHLRSATAAMDLQKRSAGWVIGLLLMLERNGLNHLGFSGRHEPEETVFDYFESEVFRKLHADDRDLLLQCALLPKMTIHRVTQLTGTPKAGTLLRELMRRNHFITRQMDELPVYQLHPLFRQFLLDKAERRYPAAELSLLRREAAEVLIWDGDEEAAIELLQRAQDWLRMTEVILATAPTLKLQGRLATLDTWLKKLPADSIQTDPWLLYWLGNSKAFSDPASSQAILENTYRQFTAAGDLTGMTMSWSGVMEAMSNAPRDIQQMDTWIAEFEQTLAHRLESLPSDIRARATVAFFVGASFRQPLHPDMSLWLDRVRRILDTSGAAERPLLRQHLVMYHILRGEHPDAEAVLSTLHYTDDLPANERPVPTLADCVSDAMVALHVGMETRCLQAVAEGLRIAEETANHVFDTLLLQLGAVISLNRGELAQADSFLAAFERLAEALPSVNRSRHYAVAAWRKFYAGESTNALKLFMRAADASDTQCAPYFIATYHLGFGLLLFLCGKASEARRQLEFGRTVGNSIQNLLIDYVYHLFSAYLALGSGEDEKAREHLVIGMRLGREHGYMHFFFFPPQVIARLCLTALELDIERTYVRALIERNKLTPDPAWPQADSWPWPICVYTLGRFSVVKQGKPLRFVGKAQKKPLELLKALIAFGGRDVPEAKLADTLWPEAEGDASARALATTLFRLRKLLGEQVIRRQDSRLTLDPTFCWVDCWTFQRLLSDNLTEAPMRLSKLRGLYQGAFLDGADDAGWARPMRERLQIMFVRVAAPPSTAVHGTVLLDK